MNKIVRLDATVYWDMFLGNKATEDMLYGEYGLECIDHTYNYKVTDESKLTLLMLINPQLIQNISYE
jgi:hypothetical protein